MKFSTFFSFLQITDFNAQQYLCCVKIRGGYQVHHPLFKYVSHYAMLS